jgi:hypothetical protein
VEGCCECGDEPSGSCATELSAIQLCAPCFTVSTGTLGERAASCSSLHIGGLGVT